jgi:hypothetical protein
LNAEFLGSTRADCDRAFRINSRLAVTVASVSVEIVARSGERSRVITKDSCSGGDMTCAVLDRGALQKGRDRILKQSADMIGVAPILAAYRLPKRYWRARSANPDPSGLTTRATYEVPVHKLGMSRCMRLSTSPAFDADRL